jgi:hypothetical protein
VQVTATEANGPCQATGEDCYLLGTTDALVGAQHLTSRLEYLAVGVRT